MSKEQIEGLIGNLQDSKEDLEKCVDLLCGLQRSKGPVTEAVIALKYEKPNLHKMLKSRLNHNPGIRMVLEL
ncbi:hypothetical protein ACFFK0_16240 [Paenibacillus chartarius]|uniref:Uncharacterized protein n=1 Tax=Paenibacillus chartarius TaxID=747481 RepID=A0ABV6DMW2_9BACL